MNSIYVIFLGSVNCYADRPATRSYLQQIQNSNTLSKVNEQQIDPDVGEVDLICVDDNVLNLQKDQLSINDQKKKLELLKAYSYGQYFGSK